MKADIGAHKPFWVCAPCEYRYRADGQYYDYVLVQGGFEPFAQPTPGPVFVPVAHSGVLTLYAKTGDPGDATSLDRGPCPADGVRTYGAD